MKTVASILAHSQITYTTLDQQLRATTSKTTGKWHHVYYSDWLPSCCWQIYINYGYHSVTIGHWYFWDLFCLLLCFQCRFVSFHFLKVCCFSAWSRNIALHNMLCLLPGPLAYQFLPSQFPSSFYIIFSKTCPSKDCEMSGTVKSLTCDLMNCGSSWYNPKTKMVGWALKTDQLPTLC